MICAVVDDDYSYSAGSCGSACVESGTVRFVDRSRALAIFGYARLSKVSRIKFSVGFF